MKLSSRIVLNVLLLTVVSSKVVYAGDLAKPGIDWVVEHKKEIGTHAGATAAGALLMFLASNEKVKSGVVKTSSAISNFTKAKYQALANYWRNLSKGKKIAATSATGAGVVAAYVYFNGPGVAAGKSKLGIK